MLNRTNLQRAIDNAARIVHEVDRVEEASEEELVERLERTRTRTRGDA